MLFGESLKLPTTVPEIPTFTFTSLDKGPQITNVFQQELFFKTLASTYVLAQINVYVRVLWQGSQTLDPQNGKSGEV